MLKCLTCDREYEGPLSRGYCVLCTIENFKANGIELSLFETINPHRSKSMMENTHLIIKLVVK